MFGEGSVVAVREVAITTATSTAATKPVGGATQPSGCRRYVERTCQLCRNNESCCQPQRRG